MMNNIYDFSEIQELRNKQNKLIFCYVAYLLCFIAAMGISFVAIQNNLLLTLVLAFILLFFILFSILFWKIKYGILDKYRSFLDDMETGKQDDYVGVFQSKTETEDDEVSFDTYVFLSAGKETGFLIHNQHKACFEKGKKYHVLHVGNYVYQWEIME